MNCLVVWRKTFTLGVFYEHHNNQLSVVQIHRFQVTLLSADFAHDSLVWRSKLFKWKTLNELLLYDKFTAIILMTLTWDSYVLLWTSAASVPLESVETPARVCNGTCFSSPVWGDWQLLCQPKTMQKQFLDKSSGLSGSRCVDRERVVLTVCGDKRRPAMEQSRYLMEPAAAATTVCFVRWKIRSPTLSRSRRWRV